MSDSVRLHRRQPTRLPCPWDSPGKNTGVGCHFLLQCMKVKSESDDTQSCLTLSNPMDCSLPGSSVHGIFQARVLEWGAITYSEIMFTLMIFINKNCVHVNILKDFQYHWNAEAESPIFWSLDASSQLLGKVPDAWKD